MTKIAVGPDNAIAMSATGKVAYCCHLWPSAGQPAIAERMWRSHSSSRPRILYKIIMQCLPVLLSRSNSPRYNPQHAKTRGGYHRPPADTLFLLLAPTGLLFAIFAPFITASALAPNALLSLSLSSLSLSFSARSLSPASAYTTRRLCSSPISNGAYDSSGGGLGVPTAAAFTRKSGLGRFLGPPSASAPRLPLPRSVAMLAWSPGAIFAGDNDPEERLRRIGERFFEGEPKGEVSLTGDVSGGSSGDSVVDLAGEGICPSEYEPPTFIGEGVADDDTCPLSASVVNALALLVRTSLLGMSRFGWPNESLGVGISNSGVPNDPLRNNGVDIACATGTLVVSASTISKTSQQRRTSTTHRS